MNQATQALEAFFAQYTRLQRKKGDILIAGHEKPDGIYFLKTGQVRKYTISAKTGNTMTIHVYQPKSYFPMTWAITDRPNRHYYEAATDVTLYRAPREATLTFLRKNPEILYLLAERVLTSIDNLLFRVEAMSFSDTYTRVIYELLYLADQYGQSDEQGGLNIGHFTHQQIAEYLGIARETVSIALKKLEREGLVTHTGHDLYIPQPELLRQKVRSF